MDMSFAQALTEANQVIVQQSNRIKADAEKIKQQQQTIVDQCSIITDHEIKAREAAAESAQQLATIEALESKVAETTVAREQLEAVCDRQGQRLTNLQQQVQNFEITVAAQAAQIEKLVAECERYRAAVPSKEDQEALAAMEALLSKKTARATAAKAGEQPERIAA